MVWQYPSSMFRLTLLSYLEYPSPNRIHNGSCSYGVQSHVLVSSRRVENGVGVRSWKRDRKLVLKSSPVLINGTNRMDLLLHQKPLWMHTILEIGITLPTEIHLTQALCFLSIADPFKEQKIDQSIYIYIYIYIRSIIICAWSISTSLLIKYFMCSAWIVLSLLRSESRHH